MSSLVIVNHIEYELCMLNNIKSVHIMNMNINMNIYEYKHILAYFLYFFSKKTQPENMEEEKALPRPILQRPPSHESLRVLRDSVSESDEHNQGDLPPLVEEHIDEPANTSGSTNSYNTKEGRCIECVERQSLSFHQAK